LTSSKLSDQSCGDRGWYLGKIGRAKQSSCSVVQRNEFIAWGHGFEKGQGVWFQEESIQGDLMHFGGLLVASVISAVGGGGDSLGGMGLRLSFHVVLYGTY
jgi:hypothetical protein